ncbi:MAG TPA: rhomboid family intramembrane serine protease [Bacteroidales bacterium]
MAPLDEEEKRQIIRAFYIPFFLLYLMWLIRTVEFIGGFSLSAFGIYPRTFGGLIGIIFSPMLHAGYAHLISNTVPFMVLTSSICYFYRSIAFKVLIIIWIITGLCVWLVGREAYHIGASGLIYGCASFLFFSGVIRKNIKLLAISLLTVFLYGGMVWGILPIDYRISWESHLFGGLTGMVLAFTYHDQGPKPEEKVWEEEPDDDPYWEVKEGDNTLN